MGWRAGKNARLVQWQYACFPSKRREFDSRISLKMKEGESQFKPAFEGEGEMRFVEGHPVCGKCLRGAHNHSLEAGERHDCKNVDAIEGKKYQCHCGFGGICKDGKWQNWEE